MDLDNAAQQLMAAFPSILTIHIADEQAFSVVRSPKMPFYTVVGLGLEHFGDVTEGLGPNTDILVIVGYESPNRTVIVRCSLEDVSVGFSNLSIATSSFHIEEQAADNGIVPRSRVNSLRPSSMYTHPGMTKVQLSFDDPLAVIYDKDLLTGLEEGRLRLAT